MEQNIEIAMSFIEKVSPNYDDGKGIIMLKSYGTDNTASQLNEENLRNLMRSHQALKSSLAFGVARRSHEILRNPKNKSQGSKDICIDAHSLKIDFDVNIDKKNRQQKSFLSDEQKQDLVLLLKKTTLHPSVIVDSGGGIHAYYVFQKPFEFTEQGSFISERVRHYEHLNKELINHFIPRVDPLVCVDKSIADASRIMRLPGTYNYKYGAPRLVQVVEVCND